VPLSYLPTQLDSIIYARPPVNNTVHRKGFLREVTADEAEIQKDLDDAEKSRF
jgi:hypothetical protein